MADSLDADLLKPAIKALPTTTVRQMGSAQVLVDPSSVVKELVENALDARATAIFVDMAANSIDSIQVKDNGHGIPAEDRALVCRRYCTSKMREFDDLKHVGGKWLGFRGEAMASMAEMSGSLGLTTRAEGEPVAVLLKFGRNGNMTSTERTSHPVGTTVKVTDLFKSLPVRRQTALKHSAKWLAKSKRLMQAYALARPTVRFSLKVLKAKTNRGDFIYAPKASANVEDAALKVIGKDCAGQCGWTAMESDGFVVQAFLPRPDANAAKLAREGAFLSIDARPVSSTRGMLKKIVTVFKGKLRKANPACASINVPFFCMNIVCPSDSYDPNIEPAKDDVLFGDEQLVVSVVEKLFSMYYLEAVVDVVEEDVASRSRAARQSQQWRSNMYGIDEEDMELVSENAPPVLEDEEEMRKAAAASNPWTLARLNASIKVRTTAENTQLMTPTKGPGDVAISSSSPARENIPRIVPTVEPLTPQSAARSNMTRHATDISLQRSIQHLPSLQRSGHDMANLQEELDEEVALLQAHQQLSAPPSVIIGPAPSLPSRSRRPPALPFEASESNYFAPGPINGQGTPLNMIPERSNAPRQGVRRQQPFSNKPFRRPPKRNNDDQDWMGNDAPVAPRQKKLRNQNRAPPPFQRNDPASPRRGLVPDAAERLVDSRLYSENNTDIRDFFSTDGLPQRGGAHPQQRSMSAEASSGFSPAFTPVNPQSRNLGNHMILSRDRGESTDPKDMAALFRAYEDRETLLSQPMSRSQSVEPRPRSQNIGDQICLHSDRGESPKSRNIGEQLRAYVSHASPVQQRGVSPSRKAVLDIETSRNTVVNSTSNGKPETRKVEKARRKSTLPHLRNKSSKVPPERVPYLYSIQDLILHMSIPNAAIANMTPSSSYFISRMRNLNMGIWVNGLEWGYPAPTADDEGTGSVFRRRVEESRVAVWCRLLGSWFETEDGKDTVGIMMEDVWGALSAMQMPEDEEMGELVGFEDPNVTVASVEMVNGTDYAHGIETTNGNNIGKVKAGTEEEEEQYETSDEDNEMLMTV